MSMDLSAAEPLRLIKLDDFVDREHIALRELERYGLMMRVLPDIVKAKGHAVVWNWLAEWHPYIFLREPNRFGDDQFYLVDRGYNPWRRHLIAFARDELMDCDDFARWQRRRELRCGDSDMIALMADATVWAMNRRLIYTQYANMIFGLVRRLEERYQLAKQRKAHA